MAREEQDRVIAYLRQARDEELAMVRTLRSHIASAPRGDYRAGLQGYLRETRGHAGRLQTRLTELGARESSLRSSARALRNAGGGVVARARVPLKPVAGGGKKVLERTKYECATEGLTIATYTALELVATRSGDHETARLAAEIRGEEQDMLEWLRHEIVKLTDSFLRDELDAWEPRDEQVERSSRPWSRDQEVSLTDVRQALSRAERDRADRL